MSSNSSRETPCEGSCAAASPPRRPPRGSDGRDVDRAALGGRRVGGHVAERLDGSAARAPRYTGSRSFQCVSTGAAMKIDEYVPDAMPTISANAKSFSVSPPKKNSASTGSSVQKLVASERVRTSDIERLTIWENVALGMRGMFSRTRSNTMIVS